MIDEQINQFLNENAVSIKLAKFAAAHDPANEQVLNSALIFYEAAEN